MSPRWYTDAECWLVR